MAQLLQRESGAGRGGGEQVFSRDQDSHSRYFADGDALGSSPYVLNDLLIYEDSALPRQLWGRQGRRQDFHPGGDGRR